MRATYFISFDGVNYSQFYPTNEPKVKLEQEAGEMFFRWKVDAFKIGKTQNATVFATLLSWFFDTTKYTTNIYYQIKEKGVITFPFIGSVLLGKMDSQNGIYEGTPEPNDAYYPILKKYDIKYQNPFGISSYAYIDNDPNTNAFANVSFTTFTPAGNGSLINWVNNTRGAAKARNIISAPSTMDIICKVTTFSGDSIIFRVVDNAGTPTGPNVTVNAVGEYLISTGTGAPYYIEAYNTSPTLKVGTFTLYFFNVDTGDLVSTCGPLRNCLNAFFGASYMNLSIATAYSTILWNNALGSDPPASISTYMTAHSTFDYVLQAAAILNNLWLSRTDAFTSTLASAHDLSLKDLADFLKYKFRVYWFIDEDGKFRLEHEKYFRSYDPQINITSATYASDKPEVDARIYSYQVGEVYKQYTYAENNQSTVDWIPYPIEFTQVVSGNRQDFNVGSFSTDIQYISDNPTKADNSGFVLLRMIQGTSQKIVSIDASDITATNFYLNSLLGWHYILKKYHSYFASANIGTVNGSAYTFSHVKEYLTQENIKFHIVTQLDWKKPVTLSHGIGWLRNAEYSPESGVININVGFTPNP